MLPLPKIMDAEKTIAHIMEITAFKDRDTAIAAIETLLWLEEGAPHKFDGVEDTVIFDMANFVNVNNCGTSCCMGGAITLFKDQRLKDRIKNKKNEFIFDYEGERLQQLFNVSSSRVMILTDNRDPELSKLFFGLNDDLYYEYHLDGIRADHAAVVFRHYLFTGKTDWKLKPKEREKIFIEI